MPHCPLRPQRTSSARLNPSFTSPSLAGSSHYSIGSLVAKRRQSRPISFGYASAGFYVRRGPNDEEWLEEFDLNVCLDDNDEDEEERRPSTSHSVEGDEGGIYTRKHNNNCINTQPMALFLLRQTDQRILPVYCYRPQGAQADQFIQSLSEKCRESIKKFLEKETPDDGECYLWVRDDVNMKTNILSLTFLQNHFKSEHIRRVKWRHLSVDKVSIYRYSLPVITTKFRLRFAHFLSRHYRCCILGVWCMVILFISIGIVLSIVFGSGPNNQKSNGTSIVLIQPSIQRSGGFMEDAIEMEKQQASDLKNNLNNGQLTQQFIGSQISQPPGIPRGIINNKNNIEKEFQWLDDK
ncbi:hypothetical protein Mgra_00007522 [Meloidogyne graminicola]|uniref:Uncharacterized protein n=1 Tax=Meloidogyne graminicola TaxID=189291 RepID=A0A8S9ZIQ0_9BILA|nr:hypothetical protein Mgra_00007522 [Meloidogyne graminicola]